MLLSIAIVLLFLVHLTGGACMYLFWCVQTGRKCIIHPKGQPMVGLHKKHEIKYLWFCVLQVLLSLSYLVFIWALLNG